MQYAHNELVCIKTILFIFYTFYLKNDLFSRSDFMTTLCTLNVAYNIRTRIIIFSVLFFRIADSIIIIIIIMTCVTCSR